MKCPPILSTVVISDNAQLAAQLSCILAKPGAYLPVIDGPRMTRDDHVAEAVRRTNGVARAKADKVIFANLSPDATALLQPRLSGLNLRFVSCTEDVAVIAREQDTAHCTPLRWGSHRIGLGLLTALRLRTTLAFTETESPISAVPSRSKHLVVCEAGEDLSEVIAANYAFALGAGLCVIPSRTKHRAREVLEAFYGLNEVRDMSPTEKLHELASLLRSLCGEIQISPGGSVTFVTDELPYGFAFPEVPSTHLFKYPDLGLAVINGFAAEQAKTRGTNIAVLVDPETTDAPEIDAAAKSLAERGMFVRGYRGPGATVHAVSQMIELFPYDLLILATHCGDADGHRWTYKYTDSEGLNRTLVVDIALGIGDTEKDDLLAVTQFIRFHSLDGVLWDDPDRSERIRVGTALNDYAAWTRAGKLEPVSKERIPRVQDSAALKMFDHNYLALPRSVADKGNPIVISNACASWRELAGRFSFANARGYVGTLFPVGTSEAHDVVVGALGKHFDKALPHAFWSAQNGVYGGNVRRPYVVTGVYPQRLRVTKENVPIRILRLMRSALGDWRRRLAADIVGQENTHKAITAIVEYYERESDAFEANWFNSPRGR